MEDEFTMEDLQQFDLFNDNIHKIILLGYHFYAYKPTPEDHAFDAPHVYEFYFLSHRRVYKMRFKFAFDGSDWCYWGLEVTCVVRRIIRRKDNMSKQKDSKIDFVINPVEVDTDVILDLLNNTLNQTFRTFLAEQIICDDCHSVCQNEFADFINQVLREGRII